MEVARIGVAVFEGCMSMVGMGTVAVNVPVGAANKAAGPLRTTARMPHRLRSSNRLKQPAIAVPTRLEFNNLLMAFIPCFLYDVDLVLSAWQIISELPDRE